MSDTTTATVRILGKCKRCKAAARLDVARTVRRGIGDYGRATVRVTWLMPSAETSGARVDGAPRAVPGDMDRVFGRCWCGGQVEFRRLVGRFSGKKCGARCMASTGPSCDCSCGGENHGRAHDGC